MMQGEGGRCFSRAEPKHKQDIVRLLKEMGEVSSCSALLYGLTISLPNRLPLRDVFVNRGVPCSSSD